MAKAVEQKPKPKPSKKAQYERFLETARELGVDDEESGKKFEKIFREIVPPRTPPKKA